MKEITSSQNDTYKYLKNLATSAKRRRREERSLLEGIHLCESYLEHVGKPALYVYSYSAPDNEEVAALMDACDKRSIPSVMVTNAQFKELSSVEHGAQILFVVAIPDTALAPSLSDNALLLEDVQDPGNMGAILRTAAAAGIQNVYASTGCASAWAPKVLRAGMGAHFALTVYQNCDLAELIKTSTVPVLATSLEASESIYAKDLSKPTAWVVGNEGKGVSSQLLSLNVEQVIIPQNPNVESLNVAAATAVCLFEQVRQQTTTA